MGSAASIHEQIEQSSSNQFEISTTSKNEIKDVLEKQYEILKGEGKNEEEIQASLSSLYLTECNSRASPKKGTSQVMVTSSSLTKLGSEKKKVTAVSSLDQNLAQKNINKGKDPPKQPQTRRRSFEAKATPILPKTGKQTQKEPEKEKDAEKSERRPSRRSSEEDVKVPQPLISEPEPIPSQESAVVSDPPTQTSTETDLSDPQPSVSTNDTSNQTPQPAGQDNWDSVSQQAYCLVCKTAFKSLGLLKKHESHSVIHAENLKKQQQQTLLAETGETLQTHAPGAAASLSSLQHLSPPQSTQAPHYSLHFSWLSESEASSSPKMIYHGSKLFWRSQETMDLHVYFHTQSDALSHVVEVIPYDIVKGKEYARIYLSYSVLSQLISEESVLQKLDELRKDHSKDKFAVLPSEVMLRDYAEQMVLTSFVLARLQKQSNSDLIYVAAGSDPVSLNPLLLLAPKVKPAQIARKRRTTTEEIQSTITSLSADREALVAATSHAEKIANLVHKGASLFRQHSSSSLVPISPMRRLWRWAIHKIVNQRRVFRTTVMLENLQIKQTQRKLEAQAAAAAQLSAELLTVEANKPTSTAVQEQVTTTATTTTTNKNNPPPNNKPKETEKESLNQKQKNKVLRRSV